MDCVDWFDVTTLNQIEGKQETVSQFAKDVIVKGYKMKDD